MAANLQALMHLANSLPTAQGKLIDAAIAELKEHRANMPALDVVRRPDRNMSNPPVLCVVALSATGAHTYAGIERMPVDLGPASNPERYKPGARLWAFPTMPCEIVIEHDLALAASSPRFVVMLAESMHDGDWCAPWASFEGAKTYCGHLNRDRLPASRLPWMEWNGMTEGNASKAVCAIVDITAAPTDRSIK